MIVVRDIIEDAYSAIGGLQDGDHLDGDRAAVGERYLNQLVASWNLKGFFAFQRQTLDFTATESKARYLIGPEQAEGEPQPDIVAQRPASITSIFVGENSEVMAFKVLLVAQSNMPGFAIAGQAGRPFRACYISSYPLGELWFDLKVPAGWKIRICYNRALPVMRINDELPVPPEYQPALTWGLAHLLTSRYQVPESVKADIKDKMAFFVDPIRDNTSAKTPVQAFVGGPYRNVFSR